MERNLVDFQSILILDDIFETIFAFVASLICTHWFSIMNLYLGHCGLVFHDDQNSQTLYTICILSWCILLDHHWITWPFTRVDRGCWVMALPLGKHICICRIKSHLDLIKHAYTYLAWKTLLWENISFSFNISPVNKMISRPDHKKNKFHQAKWVFIFHEDASQKILCCQPGL